MVVTHRVTVAVVGGHGDYADNHGHFGGVGDGGDQDYDDDIVTVL